MSLLQNSLNSSVLRSYEYDTNTNLLILTFNSGSVYYYYNVPQAVFKGFLTAGSKGRYFNAVIKGVYE